jgi:hypothetical protein
MADRDPRFPWLADDMLRESDARIRTAKFTTPEDHPAYALLGPILDLIEEAREALKGEL